MSSSRSRTSWRPGTALPRPEGAPSPRPDVLDNPAAARVARVAGLARRASRTKHGRFLAEGPQSVREAVRFAAPHVIDVYLTDAAAARYPEIPDEARDKRLYVHRVTPEVMDAMSADAQGVLAVVGTDAVAAPAATGTAAHAGSASSADTAPGPASLDTVLADGARLVVVLTETQDPGNAGTIIRAADAAGADAVVLVKGSVDPTNPKVVRSTAGSLFHLPVLAGIDLGEAVSALRAAGIQLLAADGQGTLDLHAPGTDEVLARPSAWLMGNEAHGLGEETLGVADATIAIPIHGRAESLNVATAAAVCLYASARAQHRA